MMCYLSLETSLTGRGGSCFLEKIVPCPSVRVVVVPPAVDCAPEPFDLMGTATAHKAVTMLSAPCFFFRTVTEALSYRKSCVDVRRRSALPPATQGWSLLMKEAATDLLSSMILGIVGQALFKKP